MIGKLFRLLFVGQLLLLLLNGAVYAGDTLTLKQVLGQVLSAHPLARQAALVPELAKTDLRLARGAFDPKIHARLDEKNFNNKQYFRHLDAEIKVPTRAGFDIKAGYENNTGAFIDADEKMPEGGLYYLGVSVPVLRNLVFDERRAELQEAKVFLQMSLAEQRKMLNKLFFEVNKSYWYWWASYEKLQINTKGLAVAQDRFTYVKGAHELGKYAAIDTTEAEMELQRRQVELSYALMEYNQAKLELSKHIWDENGQPLMLTDSLLPSATGTELQLISLEPLMDFALSEHPELQKANLKQNALKINQKLYRWSLLPQLDVEFKPLLAGSVNNAMLTENYKWGFTFTAPIFMRKERAKLAANQIKITQQNVEVELLTRHIQLILRQAYTALQQYEAILIAQQINTNNALQLRDAEQMRFELGSSNVFFINYRDRYYLDNLLKLADLKAKYAISKAEVYWASGQTAP
ncbi:MAG: TolC family protein [Cytophagales bacterium]|nr:MAG: TolC family protein [Cytophagales bacterium]